MNNAKMVNSVRSLTNLYTVIIGVALSISIASLVEIDKGLLSVTCDKSLLFIAFIVTLFPFYHGALRHIDDAYVENVNPNIKDGALILDFSMLLMHGIAFVILALLLKKPSHFIWTLLTVLSIDTIWGIFVHFGSSSTDSGTEGKWAAINFVFVSVGVLCLVFNDIYLQDYPEPFKISLAITVFCILRTLIDYIFCKSFYFPSDEG